ncbi:uncharacterized protein LOC130725245 [Lotus japonicus]|uniref:uncharacterized protein LOC130725245 n=1 Tax=Lotus japonicus TaxID=34305 RepID=UPI00258F77DA|nr:uncharacterized protein LOC130725245 [Lotus japonicus]
MGMGMDGADDGGMRKEEGRWQMVRVGGGALIQMLRARCHVVYTSKDSSGTGCDREHVLTMEGCPSHLLAGKRLGYKLMKAKLASLWRLIGDFDLMDVDNGFHMVKFDRNEDKDKVMGGGPWMIFDHYLAVATWSPEFISPAARVKKTLAWIRIPGLNVVFYDESYLMSAARAIGKPVVGKICLEDYWYKVEYEGLHVICTKCGCYGHRFRECTNPVTPEPSTMTKPATGGVAAPEEEVAVANDKVGAMECQDMEIPPSQTAVTETSEMGGKSIDEAIQVERPAIIANDEAGAEPLGQWMTVVKKKKNKKKPVVAMKKPAAEEQKMRKTHNGKEKNDGAIKVKDSTRKQHRILGSNHGALKLTKKVPAHNEERGGSAVENKGKWVFQFGSSNFKIVSWNIRGSVHDHGKLALKDIIRCKKPDVVILLETKCQFKRVSRFWNTLDYTPIFIEEARGFSGGIWVLSHRGSNVSFRLVKAHPQVVTFEVWKANLSWVCSAMYASPIPAQRDTLWNRLLHLRSSIILPWLLVGDFNEILLPSEVRGGDFLANRADLFASILDQCNLIDSGSVGRQYTWFRKVNNRLVLSKRLDRAFVTYTQDCPFHFLAAWAEHSQFETLVENSWRTGEENISLKLNRIREASQVFNKEVFGNIFRRKRHIEGRLRGVQRELDSMVTSNLVMFEAELQWEYRNILKQEELMWYQKARDNRVKFGDRNTAYFHTQTVIRRKRNHIHQLKVGDGGWCSDVEVLKQEVQDFFTKLFAVDTSFQGAHLSHDRFPTLTDEAKASLVQPVTQEEVKEAFMSMKSYTAPGPDGFQPFFYKKYWNHVGQSLWKLVRDAFQEGQVNED